MPLIHAAYDTLDASGRSLFHPGFLGHEGWTVRGLAGRILLRFCARDALQAFLVRIPGSPYLLARVAKQEDVVAGFSFIVVRKTRRGRRGSFGIFVRPGFEGRGLGGRLTAAALDLARRDVLQEVELTVQVRNERARRLYERCGFRLLEILPGGDAYEGTAYDTVRMVTRLSPPDVSHG